MSGDGDALRIQINAAGSIARLPQAAASMFSGAEPETIDAHSIQPYYTALLAKECGLTIETVTTSESVTLIAARAASVADRGDGLPSSKR